MTSFARVLVFPSSSSVRPDDSRFLAASLTQLCPDGLFKRYDRASLHQYGIPDKVIEYGFPLYSFGTEPAYFAGSIVSTAVRIYPGLNEHLDDRLLLLEHSALLGLSHVGGVALDADLVQERLSALIAQGVLEPGPLPVKYLNLVLRDLVAATLGKPIAYRSDIRLSRFSPEKKKDRPPRILQLVPLQERTYGAADDPMTCVELVQTYQFLVQKIAYQIITRLPWGVEVDDLISEGWVGFFDAVKKYEPAKGAFPSYASLRIRGAILDYLRSLDSVPRSVRAVLNEVDDAERKLRALHPLAEVTLDAILTEAGVSRERYEECRKDAVTVVSVDDPGSNTHAPPNERLDFFDSYFRHKGPTPEDINVDAELETSLRQAIQRLEHSDDRTVVDLYYFSDLNLREIGKILGVCEARVSQIHTRALKELRQTWSVQELRQEP